MLKADAYGHGAPAVARTLERAGADGFCVALLEEAVELREAGIRAPILVMGGHYGSDPGAYEEVVARELVPVVHDIEQVAAFARVVRAGVAPGPVGVHLKIDTGMARLGVTMQALPDLAARLAEYPEVRVAGLMTHLASADAPTDEQTAEQMARFEEATGLLARHGVSPEIRHAANSAATLRAQARFDVVRPGIALFGVSPEVAGRALTTELRPVMRVRTEIVDVRDVPKPELPVGYGATWRAARASRIATLPLGYADGLSRRLASVGAVLVRGKRAPIVGAVSMDMTAIDVTGTCLERPTSATRSWCSAGRDGPLGKDCIGADEIAAQADTIPWEVLTSVSRRVPRFYREP